MRHRTFIAVDVPSSVRKSSLLVMESLRTVTGDVKWVEPENLHWTLQFLGDVDEDDVPEVCSGVATAVARFEPFTLQVRGTGAFPSNDRPRTLWLGAGAGAEQLIDIQAAIQKQLGKLGYRGEKRRFVPHLTLGRAGRNASPRDVATHLEELAAREFGTMLVGEVTIFSSTLGRNGPVYESLGQAPLLGDSR